VLPFLGLAMPDTYRWIPLGIPGRICPGAPNALLGCIPRGSDHGADLGGTDCSPSEQLSSLALGLRSRYLHAPTIIPAKKPLLDLYGDFVQPFLGTICPVHLIGVVAGASH
jgi:hypothetical protein